MGERHKNLALQPSSAERWLNCPGSVREIMRLADKLPEEQVSEWSELGTQAHALAAEALELGDMPKSDLPADVIKAVKLYVAFCEKHTPAGAQIFIERKFPLPYMPKRNGQVDYLVVDRRDNGDVHVLVVDYKNGEGKPVFAKQNAQMAIYAWAAAEALKLKPRTYTLAILQPRIDPEPSTWCIDQDDLDEFLKPYKDMAEDIQNEMEDPELCEGSWCQFCPLKMAKLCSAKNGKASEALVVGGADHLVPATPASLELVPPEAMSDEQLATCWKGASTIAKWVDAVKAEARKRVVELRKPLPGLKAVAGKSSCGWTSEDAAKKLLANWLSIDEYAPRALVSPAGAEKLLADKDLSTKGKNKLEALIVKSSGAPLVALEDDAREALALDLTSELENLDIGSSANTSTYSPDEGL